MDKEAIRVKAQDTAAAIWPGEGSRHQNTDIIEAALAQVWNKAVEASDKALDGESIVGINTAKEAILRLRIEGEEEGT